MCKTHYKYKGRKMSRRILTLFKPATAFVTFKIKNCTDNKNFKLYSYIQPSSLVYNARYKT